MRIESSALHLQGSSQIATASYVEENLEFWITGQGQGNQRASGTGLSIDIQEFTQQSIRTSVSATTVSKSAEIADEDPVATKEEMKIRLLEQFLTRLTGKKIKLNVVKPRTEGYDSSGYARLKSEFALGTLQMQRSQGFGLIYSRSETLVEKSRVTFSAQGIVKTADGREISLDLNFNIDQEIYQHSSFNLRAGDALVKDPLVINFAGDVASFSNKTMDFDIDFDGDLDTIQMLSANNGYLALDKNQNGTIDDGRELFGPQTDEGYEELAQYDEDKNGWIDENDSIFDHLKIWYHEEDGSSRLAALTDKNVGAIYLGSASTKMSLYSSAGFAGELRKSGLVLLENGESRIMQELDVRI